MSTPVEGGAPTETKRRRTVKERSGVVVSAKAMKTVIVSVERRVQHAKYKKYVTVRKRFAAHDEVGCQVGDQVVIRETRPISKTKRWRVASKLDAKVAG
jgi:small subunit ribosomal protein S17